MTKRRGRRCGNPWPIEQEARMFSTTYYSDSDSDSDREVPASGSENVKVPENSAAWLAAITGTVIVLLPLSLHFGI